LQGCGRSRIHTDAIVAIRALRAVEVSASGSPEPREARIRGSEERPPEVRFRSVRSL
jgi:hypothetical protein